MKPAILVSTLVTLLAVAAAFAQPPPADQNLVLTAPVRTWDEALPLGNGLTGGLLWGEGSLLRVSLDRGDLWDERPGAEPGWWKKRTWKAGGDWDGPYNGATPTKLPAGRLEISLDPSQQLKAFELNLATAEGVAHLTNGGRLGAFFSAAAPVALLRIPGPVPKALALIPAGASKDAGDAGPSSGGAVKQLGYPAAVRGMDGQARWFLQEAAEGLKYCVCIESRRLGEESLVAIAITSTIDGADPLALARKRCAAAVNQGYAAMLAPHVAWWKEFWDQSSLTVPEPAIQNYAALCRYFYGAASQGRAADVWGQSFKV